MTGIDRFFLRLARWIAGSERVEWVDAMEAEAASADGSSTAWAIGCVTAAFKERIWRERSFVALIAGLPATDFILRWLLFFPVVLTGEAFGLPGWTFIAVFLALGFPFAFYLGRTMPRVRAVVAALLCGALLEIGGIVQFWIAFGKGPEIWFQPNSHVYNMTPVLGWTTSISIWLAGALVGSLAGPKGRRRKSDPA
jgi:hypothetical protein